MDIYEVIARDNLNNNFTFTFGYKNEDKGIWSYPQKTLLFSSEDKARAEFKKWKEERNLGDNVQFMVHLVGVLQ